MANENEERPAAGTAPEQGEGGELQRNPQIDSLALRLRSTIKKIRATLKAPGAGARCW